MTRLWWASLSAVLSALAVAARVGGGLWLATTRLSENS
jgi:hypothetical protein